jgi:HK97 family phage prohead protease
MKTKNRAPIVSAPEWRSLQKDGRIAALTRFIPIQREAASDGSSSLSIVASTSQPDRYGDTINQLGWETGNYEANPVMLWAHSYDTAPVGKVGRLEKGSSDLRCKDIEWTPPEMNAFGAQVGEMVRAGFLNTVSVGFLPIQWEERRDPETGSFLGYHFVKQELLEISVVPVPANPGALVDSKGFAGAIRDWAGRHDESSPMAKAWSAELAMWLKSADDLAEQSEQDRDESDFTELVSLMRSLLESSRETNSHLGEMRSLLMSGTVARSGKLQQDEQSRALEGALNTLFPRRKKEIK